MFVPLSFTQLFPMRRTLKANLQELRDHVRAGCTNRPGIYRMLGKGGVVLYVGKSKRVRTRLMSYFRARSNQKAWRIVRDARGIEWEYTPSEFASLVRELELIKLYRPPYNVMRKRDGIYCFVKLGGGVAPRLQVVRKLREENAQYFGPLLGGQRIVEAIKELNDALQLRDCRNGTPIHYSDQANLFGLDRAPLCPRQELRRCCAPCAGLCSAAEYRERMGHAKAFLDGASDYPIRILRERMQESIDRMAFEHAALTQMRIERLLMLREEFRRLRESTEQLSFLYTVQGHGGEHLVYAIRSGSIRERFPAPRNPRELRSLLKAAHRHFEQPETVAEATTPKRVEELLLVSHWFRTRSEEFEHTYPVSEWDRLPLASDLDAEVQVA